jgi:hypothetical protein
MYNTIKFHNASRFTLSTLSSTKNYSVPQQSMVDNQLYTYHCIFNIHVTWKACVLYHTLFVKGRISRDSRRVSLRLQRKKDFLSAKIFSIKFSLASGLKSVWFNLQYTTQRKCSRNQFGNICFQLRFISGEWVAKLVASSLATAALLV